MTQLKIIKVEKPSGDTVAGSGIAGFSSSARAVEQPFVCGTVSTSRGTIPAVATELTFRDYRGEILSRISAFRMRYRVDPGLYAVGRPDSKSDVFVTANYKMSFDRLRVSLRGIDAYILVLDTRGINVWCAAGKGTFGTQELISRVRQAGLGEIVEHRRLIVPQLGAPGVSSPVVKKETGFRVSFGPVLARDIPEYLAARYRATSQMRVIRFSLADRLVLTPMEIIPALRQYPLFALIVLLIFGLQPEGILFGSAWYGGFPFLLLGLGSILAGALLTPALLPWIPIRSFALKGAMLGLVVVVALVEFTGVGSSLSPPLRMAAYLLFPALASYIALQFTGSTTFTGVSGVKRELKYAVPLYFTAVIGALLLVAANKLLEWKLI